MSLPAVATRRHVARSQSWGRLQHPEVLVRWRAARPRLKQEEIAARPVSRIERQITSTEADFRSV